MHTSVGIVLCMCVFQAGDAHQRVSVQGLIAIARHHPSQAAADQWILWHSRSD